VDDVRLPDLEVIKRFSIAVRREHAPAEEVIAALRADLEKITGRARTPAPRVERDDEPAPRPRRMATPAKPAPRAKPKRARAALKTKAQPKRTATRTVVRRKPKRRR